LLLLLLLLLLLRRALDCPGRTDDRVPRSE
jgi:hypothetical protein